MSLVIGAPVCHATSFQTQKSWNVQVDHQHAAKSGPADQIGVNLRLDPLRLFECIAPITESENGQAAEVSGIGFFYERVPGSTGRRRVSRMIQAFPSRRSDLDPSTETNTPRLETCTKQTRMGTLGQYNSPCIQALLHIVHRLQIYMDQGSMFSVACFSKIGIVSLLIHSVSWFSKVGIISLLVRSLAWQRSRVAGGRDLV
jgi:hypothetical protein